MQKNCEERGGGECQARADSRRIVNSGPITPVTVRHEARWRVFIVAKVIHNTQRVILAA